MPEGLSPSEVGKELAEHRHKAEEKEQGEGTAAEVRGRERWLTITVRAARIGLVSIGGVILVFASISLILAPKPPV
jgi:hypothetical protein